MELNQLPARQLRAVVFGSESAGAAIEQLAPHFFVAFAQQKAHFTINRAPRLASLFHALAGFRIRPADRFSHLLRHYVRRINACRVLPITQRLKQPITFDVVLCQSEVISQRGNEASNTWIT
jgi:hypothetical protein